MMAKNIKQANATLIIAAVWYALFFSFNAHWSMAVLGLGLVGYGLYYKFISK